MCSSARDERSLYFLERPKTPPCGKVFLPRKSDCALTSFSPSLFIYNVAICTLYRFILLLYIFILNIIAFYLQKKTQLSVVASSAQMWAVSKYKKDALFLKKNDFFNVFIFGCAGSLLLCRLFPSLGHMGATL